MYGTYDPHASSTYNYVSSAFHIEYVGGARATGDYVTDTIAAIGNSKLKNFQFGAAYNATIPREDTT